MLGFLFVDEAEFQIDPEDSGGPLTTDARPVLATADEALSGLASWTAADIEAALRAALVDGLGLKPRAAFGGARCGSRSPAGGLARRCSSRSNCSAGTRTLGRLAQGQVIAAPA